jgi:hypothetical protein
LLPTLTVRRRGSSAHPPQPIVAAVLGLDRQIASEIAPYGELAGLKASSCGSGGRAVRARRTDSLGA